MYFLQNQYKFVFETLLEYTRGIDSRFPVSELANKIKERGVKDKKTKKNVYQMEFEVRCHAPLNDHCCFFGHITMNMSGFFVLHLVLAEGKSS